MRTAKGVQPRSNIQLKDIRNENAIEGFPCLHKKFHEACKKAESKTIKKIPIFE